jgi:hypothetical protein
VHLRRHCVPASQLASDRLVMHGLILRTRTHKIYVSCECRTKLGETKNFKDGSRSTVYIGETHDLNETKELYNDPENHWEPFDPETDGVKFGG